MENFTRAKHIEEIQKIDYEYGMTIQTEEHKKKFMDANLINLVFDTPIYRIFAYDRFLQTLNEQKLCLVKPKIWDDPFENFLLNAEGYWNGKSISFEPIREQFYGQCWSLKEECDGLWRNYTNKSCKKCDFYTFKEIHGRTPISIKVKTTVGKLMNALYDESNCFHNLCYFIGKVDYCDMTTISNCLEKALQKLTDTTGINQVLSLLMKREPFKYEEEVRMIFMRPDDTMDMTKIRNPWQKNSDVFFVSINPNDLFDEVVIDPWVNSNEFDRIKNCIQNYYKGDIKKSNLYDDPHLKVIIK